MAKSGRTITRKGRRVVVTFKDSQTFYDRFVERPKHRRWVVFESLGRVPMSKIASVADYKGEKRS